MIYRSIWTTIFRMETTTYLRHIALGTHPDAKIRNIYKFFTRCVSIFASWLSILQVCISTNNDTNLPIIIQRRLKLKNGFIDPQIPSLNSCKSISHGPPQHTQERLFKKPFHFRLKFCTPMTDDRRRHDGTIPITLLGSDRQSGN